MHKTGLHVWIRLLRVQYCHVSQLHFLLIDHRHISLLISRSKLIFVLRPLPFFIRVLQVDSPTLLLHRLLQRGQQVFKLFLLWQNEVQFLIQSGKEKTLPYPHLGIIHVLDLPYHNARRCKKERKTSQVFIVSYLFWSSFTFSTSLCNEVIWKQKTPNYTTKIQETIHKRGVVELSRSAP